MAYSSSKSGKGKKASLPCKPVQNIRSKEAFKQSSGKKK